MLGKKGRGDITLVGEMVKARESWGYRGVITARGLASITNVSFPVSPTGQAVEVSLIPCPVSAAP